MIFVHFGQRRTQAAKYVCGHMKDVLDNEVHDYSALYQHVMQCQCYAT